VVFIIVHYSEGLFYVLFHLVHVRDVPGGVYVQSFIQVLQNIWPFSFLMLDDGGCLNALLLVDVFPLTLAHFLWDQDIEYL
jgi:hypothetical protein